MTSNWLNRGNVVHRVDTTSFNCRAHFISLPTLCAKIVCVVTWQAITARVESAVQSHAQSTQLYCQNWLDTKTKETWSRLNTTQIAKLPFQIYFIIIMFSSTLSRALCCLPVSVATPHKAIIWKSFFSPLFFLNAVSKLCSLSVFRLCRYEDEKRSWI